MQTDFPDIPGYELRDILGEGGFATVYLARQILLDRLVALKVMDPNLARDREFCERFVREARDTASLGNHANIVTVFDIGRVGDIYYIAMQYLPGPNLKDLLDAAEPYRHPLHIVHALAGALAYAHARGFVHRDVKPANVLFDEAGDAVLSDFGIAKSLGRSTRLTTAGAIIGTAKYMSPEQAKGLETIDHRSDLYSLGVVLFELLTRTPPYRSRDAMTLMLMHVSEPVPTLPAPEAMYQPLIDRLMAKRPEERYASGEELIADIDRYMSDITMAGSTDRVTPAIGGVGANGAITGRRMPRALLVALAAAVLLVAGGGYLLLNPADIVPPVVEAPAVEPDPGDYESLPDGERERLKRVLDVAELHELVGRVSDPPGANAIEAYELALELDPGNAVASEALARLQGERP